MWSMPRNVLRVVAVLLGLCAVGGFALGVGDPTRGPAPKEAAGAVAGPNVPVADARPLNTDAPPPPPEPDPEEEKAKELAANEKAEAAAAKLAAAQAQQEKAAALKAVEPPRLAVPAPDQVGDLIEAVTPPEEPPH